MQSVNAVSSRIVVVAAVALAISAVSCVAWSWKRVHKPTTVLVSVLITLYSAQWPMYRLGCYDWIDGSLDSTVSCAVGSISYSPLDSLQEIIDFNLRTECHQVKPAVV